MRKVLVIGSGGAGKTALALQVGEITGLPVVHLDRLYWEPGWTVPDRDVWHQRLQDAMSRDEWILDGNYSATIDTRLAEADTVLFLDFSPLICIWRVIRRYLRHRGSSRPDMAPGCEERLTLGFLHWIWTFRSRRRDGLHRMLRKHSRKADVVVLRSQKEMNRYVENLRASSAQPR